MMADISDSLSIDDKARMCFLALADERLSLSDCTAWLDWLDADSRHQQAFDRVTQVWKALDGCRGIIQRSAEISENVSVSAAQHTSPPGLPSVPSLAVTSARRIRITGVRWPAVFLGMLLVVISVLATWDDVWCRPQVFEARVAEKRVVTLNDGSQIMLAGDSRVEVDYSRRTRHIALVRGHAMFSVAKDANRPFVVHADHGEMTALGTQFDVNKMSNSVVIIVKEGIVKVVSNALSAEGRKSASTLLGMGEKVSYSPAGGLGRVEQVDLERELSWENGRLVFVDKPLEQAIEEVNRYSRTRIQFRPEDIAGLSVSGTVNLDQIDEWVQGLEIGYPLKALPGGGDMILLVRSSVEPKSVGRRDGR